MTREAKRLQKGLGLIVAGLGLYMTLTALKGAQEARERQARLEKDIADIKAMLGKGLLA